MMDAPRVVGAVVIASVAILAGATGARAETTPERAGRVATGAAGTAQTVITDSRVTAKTTIDLFADERVKGSRISVETVNGTVTLRGTVDSHEAKAAAVSIAHGIDGAKRVRNHLQVVPPGDRPAVEASDKKITRQVESRLSQDVQLKQVSARTNGGKVFLTGTVPSVVASARASELARGVTGARAVKNELTYDPASRAVIPAPRSSPDTRMNPSTAAASGSRAQVMAMQQALKDKGFDPGPIDGTVGPQTIAAATAYQKAEQISVAGQVDAGTAAKLGMKGVRGETRYQR